MPGCVLVIEDEINIKINGLPVDVRRQLVDTFRFHVPGARYTPQYKLGRWDGTVSYFGLAGSGYLNHLDRIIPVLDKNGYQISEIVDRRQKIDLSMDPITEEFWGDTRWPEGHPIAGELIRLRDYQVDVINKFLETPQSLQSVATGSGKCLAGDTLLRLEMDTQSEHALRFLPDVRGEFTTTMKELADDIEEILGLTLQHDVAVDISSLGLAVEAPLMGSVDVNWFVKKENLSAVRVRLVNGHEIECSREHLLSVDGDLTAAQDIATGDCIDLRDEVCEVESVTDLKTPIDCYDISVDNPHLYYDAAGVLHHNTIITATLSKITEKFGRSIVIVPNKSLVTQTYADYDNCGLDVGMYFGDQKDVGKTHTICTWQSIMAMKKAFASGKSELSFAKFLDGVSTVIVDECFHGDTPILTTRGYVPIKDVVAGDTVVNYCEETMKFKTDIVLKKHENLSKSSDEEMLELEFDNDTVLKVTANHKFLTSEGWIRADRLTADMDIINYNIDLESSDEKTHSHSYECRKD